MIRVMNLENESADVIDQAAHWVARWDSGSISETEIQHFEEWINARPDHQTAFEELKSIWNRMDKTFPPLSEEQLRSPPDPDILTKTFSADQRPRWIGENRTIAGIAAAALLVFGISAFLLGYFDGGNIHRTHVGETRVVIMEDGSEMILNTNTKVSLHYDDQARRISLASGEAYFKVAKDPRRPFVVSTDSGTIEAIGTEFNVFSDHGAVEVLVAEGIVEIVVSPEERFNSRELEPQTLVLAEKQGSTIKGQRVELEDFDTREIMRVLSWQEQKLEFDNETLAQAIKEIERYTNKRIFIMSEELTELRIGGICEVGDVEGFVDALEDFFPVEVVHVTPFITLLLKTET